MGDQVLANVSAVLRSVLRARDFVGRNGGEEFAVLLPDTQIPVALEIAERIRAAVAGISLPGSDVSVTTSVGVVASRSLSGMRTWPLTWKRFLLGRARPGGNASSGGSAGPGSWDQPF